MLASPRSLGAAWKLSAREQYVPRADIATWNGRRRLSVTRCDPHFPVFDTSLGKLGVAICYDRHFEGVISALARGGAELIASPAVTFGSKSEHLWDLEFDVDAARHGLFIAGSNRRGTEAPWNQPYFGKSHVIGPNGRCPRIDLGNDTLVVTDVDLGELDRPDPSGWDLSRDRRPDICSR